MRYVRLGVLAVLVGVIAFGCSTDKPAEMLLVPSSSNAPELNASLSLVLPCTEALCDFGPQPPATGMVANGIGLRGSVALQPATFDVNVPGTVVKAYAYWEGAMMTTGGGDDQIMINANGGGATAVNGTFIGGDTQIVPQYFTYAYRADITSMVTSNANNSFEVSGLDFDARCPSDCRNDGVAVVVLYDDGVSVPKEIVLKEGNDFAFYDFAPTLDAVVPQTYAFSPSTDPRTASLWLIAGSVEANRPNVVEITPNVGPVQRIVDPLMSNKGGDWDVIELSVDIPAGAESITVDLLSEKDASSVFTGIPASMIWVFGGLCIEPQGFTSCTPGYYRNLKQHQHAWDDAGYSTGAFFNVVFGVTAYPADYTLYDAIWARGGGLGKIARHGTAALLNAAHPGVDYPATVAEVKAAVKAAVEGTGSINQIAFWNDEYPCTLNNRSQLPTFSQ